MAWTSALNKVVSDRIQIGMTEFSKFPFLANTVYSDILGSADEVSIVNVGAVSVATYVPGTDMADGTPAPTATTLKCDQYRSWNFTLDDTVKLVGDTAVQLANKHARTAALAADKYVLGLATKANFPTNWYAGSADAAIEVNSSIILDVIEELAKNMKDNDVPIGMGFVCLTSGMHTMVLRALRKSGLPLAEVSSAMFQGTVLRFAGLDIVQSNQYVETTASTKDFKILYGTVDAIAAASRSPTVESARKEKQFATYLKGLIQFGAKVTQEELGGAAYLKEVAES